MMKTKMLVDIGNSTLAYAAYTPGSLGPMTRLKTSDILENSSLPIEILKASHIIVSSVVPSCDTLFPPEKTTFITAKTIPTLNVNIPNPAEVGSDRIVNALGAYITYKQPCLIIDSGTAVTFCLVDENGAYQGGTIFPGMQIASKALNDYTAKIPLIYVEEKENILGKSTKESVQNGLYFGYIELINGVINRYKKEYPNLKIIGTGSGLQTLMPHLQIDDLDPYLIMKGLQVCAKALD